MCTGAIIHSRVKRVVYGATDPKAGASESAFNILGTDCLNHQVNISVALTETIFLLMLPLIKLTIQL